ncbi:chromate transporter [Rhodovarius crocodyli]|uniref:Chromate transporter n=1 Tax=Rhodovarius crocodyli TaxID=1979269 RepID=A0A437MP40_9PROT|nr:chromate transporter [Rhodovarius crocodyli]RVT99421.1 chromate transporter [Rhodovarius crocodyli]
MTERHVPTTGELFLAFLQIGGLAFGGAVAFARSVLVDQRKWLTEREYAELLGLGQVLPGPNVGNFAVIYGRQCRGLMGSVAAMGGFILLPLFIVLGLVALWMEYGQNPWLDAFMKGVAAAAAGLAVGSALKSLSKLTLPVEQLVAVGVICLLAAWARVPLGWIILFCTPVTLALSLYRGWKKRKAA